LLIIFISKYWHYLAHNIQSTNMLKQKFQFTGLHLVTFNRL
jgi:hypothetical protein